MTNDSPRSHLSDLLRLYEKKVVNLSVGSVEFPLKVPVDVFSSHAVDRGTTLLFKSLGQCGRTWPRVLDVGCGYGTIGIWLARSHLAQTVDGIDRDSVAVAYARENVGHVDTGAVIFWGGLAYDDVQRTDYDLVVTNLPAKAGAAVHSLILLGASEHLAPGGEVLAVVVAPLEKDVDRILDDERVSLTQKWIHKSHVVYHYSFRAAIKPDDDSYFRVRSEFECAQIRYTIDAVSNLPEFDTLSRTTELAYQLFLQTCKERHIARLAVLEPTQGHFPILLTKTVDSIDQILLLSRDLLSLRASAKNLVKNGFARPVALVHGAELPGSEMDLIAGTLIESEGMEIEVARIQQMCASNPNAMCILGCSASFGGRLEKSLKKLGFHLPKKLARKGFAALAIESRSRARL